MAYFTKVRLHYRTDEGKVKIAPAHSIIFDMDDDGIQTALGLDYIRPATEGEAADARALMPAPKKLAKKTSKAERQSAGKETQGAGDDTQSGGDDTQSGGAADDDLA